MTILIFTSPGWNPALLKSMEDMTTCFVIDAIAFSLFSIMSITHWMVYSEPLPCWFITLISTSATVHFVILSYQMNMKKIPFPVIEEINKNKIIITSSNQEDDEISQKTVQKTDTPVANNKCCKCSSSASVTVTTANGEEMCWVHDNIKEIVVWNFTPFLSILMMLTSPWYKSRVDITTLLMLEAFVFSQISILSITFWVVLSEPLSCWLTTLIFISTTAQFVKLSYDMKYKKVFITLSSQEEEDEDEDEEISQETDTPRSSSASSANDEEEHEKLEKKWMRKFVAEEFRAHESSKFIEEMNELRNKCLEDRREWEQDRNTLLEGHEKLEKKWMRKCVAEEFRAHESSKFIEEMNELRNKCLEDRREWEQDRNTLLEGLSAANKSVQLYRSLLHEFDQIYTSSN